MEPYQKVGARYYDATFGRFITRDTDLSQSPYAYCDGDPVNLLDADGHAPTKRFWYWAGVTLIVAGEIIGTTAATLAGGGVVAVVAGGLTISGTLAWAYGGDAGGPFFTGGKGKGSGGKQGPSQKEPTLPGRKGGGAPGNVSTSATNQDYYQGSGNNWYPYGPPYTGAPHNGSAPPGAILH